MDAGEGTVTQVSANRPSPRRWLSIAPSHRLITAAIVASAACLFAAGLHAQLREHILLFNIPQGVPTLVRPGPQREIAVHLDADGNLLCDGHSCTRGQLRVMLNNEALLSPQPWLVVSIDPEARYGRTLEVLTDLALLYERFAVRYGPSDDEEELVIERRRAIAL